MERVVEARVPASRVWEAWEKAHERMEKGVHGQKKGFRYQILEVDHGRSFSILWKTFFARLIFTHAVLPTKRGCEIRYSFQIKGFFAWPMRWLLGKKIEANLSQVLKSIVKQLEESA